MISVGLISDTHGLLRQEALDALQGSDYIIHAGDISKQSIIDSLATIAPVTAVRGNVDKGKLAIRYAPYEVLKIGDIYIYVLHIIDEIDLDPVASGFQVVVYGHTHKPSVRQENGVLFVNPGSAGPKRFSLPVTVGRLEINGPQLDVTIINIIQ